MRVSNLAAGLAAALALTAAGSAQAAITLSLGQSSEIFTQYGQGIDGTGRGTFREGQGASTFDGVTSTFVLSGSILSSNTPALNFGTYEFITTYPGADTPNGGPNAPRGRTNAANPLQFNYAFVDPATEMKLILHTPTGDVTHVFFSNGVFDGGFSFQIQNGVCTGLGALPCTQKNVGETPGSTLYGPVTMFVSWDTPTGAVPEPGAWALMIGGFGAVGAALRRRRNLSLAKA